MRKFKRERNANETTFCKFIRFLEYHCKLICTLLVCLLMAGMMVYELTHKVAEDRLTVAIIGSQSQLEETEGTIRKDSRAFWKEVRIQYVIAENATMRQKYVAQMAAGEIDIVYANSKEYAKLIQIEEIKKLNKKTINLRAAKKYTLKNYYFLIPNTVKSSQQVLKSIENLN